MNSEKKYTLITGGTSGIGRELARVFADNGHNLIIVARNQDDLALVKQELGSRPIRIHTVAKDLFDPRAAFELYEEILGEGLEVDILVNNAGQGLYGQFVETDIHRELDIIQLNVSSLVVLTKLFLKDMISRNSGRILNLSSIAGKAPGPFQSVYHGTKAFVQSFTEAIRDEVKDTGVSLTALLPGATDTDFFNKADMQESKIVQEGNLASPAKVAEDGYKALMSGDDMIVSGFMNKLMVAMSAMLPDSVLAKQMHKQQEPADPKKTSES